MEMTTTPLLGFILGGLEGIPMLAGLILAIVATVRVVRRTDGPATPLWIFLIWVLPFIGAIVAIVVTKHRPLEMEVTHTPTPPPAPSPKSVTSDAAGGLETLRLDH